MNRKKLKLFSVILSLVLLLSSVNVLANDRERNVDNESIKAFVTEYLDSVDRSFADLSIDPKLGSFFEDTYNLDYQAIDLLIEHCKMQLSNLRYSNYHSDLTFEEISQEDDDRFKVIVNKKMEMYYACLNGVQSGVYEQHRLEIKRKADGNFVILVDENSDEARKLLKDRIAQGESLLFAKNRLLEESRVEANIHKTNYEKMVETIQKQSKPIIDEDDVILTGFNFKNYSRYSARGYAYRYVYSPNPAYVNFESMGGNCTNFTSQCLAAGGIVFDLTGNYRWYYHNSNNRAPAWTHANYFGEYYRNNFGSSNTKGLRAFPSDFSSMRLGDLVQLVDNSGTAYHTMIITTPICDNWVDDDALKWKAKYDVGICQNSVDINGRQKDIPLSKKVGFKEYIHVVGSYS